MNAATNTLVLKLRSYSSSAVVVTISITSSEQIRTAEINKEESSRILKRSAGCVMKWVTGLFWRSPNFPHKLKDRKKKEVCYCFLRGPQIIIFDLSLAFVVTQVEIIHDS